MTQSPLKERQYVWRWIWETHLGWNEINFDPIAHTSIQGPVSPVLPCMLIKLRTPVCVSVWVLQKWQRERGRWNRITTLDPPSKEEISQLNRSYQSCHSSITQMYQDIKDLTDVKRVKVCGDEERRFQKGKMYWISQRGSFEQSFDNATGCSYCILMLLNWNRERERDK